MRRDLLQAGAAHQVSIDGGCGFASFGNGPHNEGLTAAHVTGCENAGNRTHVILCGDIAARVEIYAQLLNHARLYRSQETQREQHKISLQDKFRPWHGLKFRRRTDTNGVQLLDVAFLIACEAGGRNGPIPQAAFFVRALGT